MAKKWEEEEKKSLRLRDLGASYRRSVEAARERAGVIDRSREEGALQRKQLQVAENMERKKSIDAYLNERFPEKQEVADTKKPPGFTLKDVAEYRKSFDSSNLTEEEKDRRVAQMISAVSNPPEAPKEPERLSYARVKPESAATRQRLLDSGEYEETPDGYLQQKRGSNISASVPRETLRQFDQPTMNRPAPLLKSIGDKIKAPVATVKPEQTVPEKRVGAANNADRLKLKTMREKRASKTFTPEPFRIEKRRSLFKDIDTGLKNILKIKPRRKEYKTTSQERTVLQELGKLKKRTDRDYWNRYYKSTGF